MHSIQRTLTNFLRNVILRQESKRKFTVCVEGNIGSGKTTFLNNFKIYNNTAVLQEPVQLWQNVAGQNLLELMYKNPDRYAYLFQSYVQLTMTQLHAINTPEPYKIMERSAYSARVFIENMKRNKMLEEVEFHVLEAWFDWSIENAGIETDLIIYLRTSPEVVYERMQQRGRKEEDCVSLEYLKQLHQIHDEWLLEGKICPLPSPVITLNGDKSLEDMITEFNICKESIYKNQISYKAKAKNQRIKEATGFSD